MMLSGEAKEALREDLLALGFDEARFTDLAPLSNVRLEEWLDLGYHADMEWLRRSVEKRLNPSLVLEESCSVIMLGVNYCPESDAAQAQRRWGKYSLYEDYHDTVNKGLKSAGKLLENKHGLSGSEYRYYVDTGPVMERGWAAASGLGWQGKNAMLISRSHGNWLLLATILTRLPIEPDFPLKRSTQVNAPRVPELGLLCGKCERCIEACPTNAIVEPGMIDANLCISYQTIENKAVIPRELRSLIGSRIFGCDICLDICPWNRFAETGRRMLLSSREDISSIDLLDILKMTEESFREFFRKTPMKRLKWRGLLRNACIVAGNLKEDSEWIPGDKQQVAFVAEIVDALLPLAIHPELLVRPHAVWALYRLAGNKATGLLAEARASESDEATLEEYDWWEGKAS